MTGQILKCDGGKSLTSSGFTSWYGLEQMDRRFEATGASKLGHYVKTVKDTASKLTTRMQPGTVQWVNELQTSNWATHKEDAHAKVTEQYVKMDPEQDELQHYVDMHQEGGVENPKKATKIKK